MTDAPAQAGGDALAASAGARVVSFDVFDTLFHRLLPEAEAVFDLVGERFGIFGFRSARVAAQAAAFSAMRARGEREVTLDGIYACLPDVGVSAEDLKRAEWDLESAVLRPSPAMVAVLDACRARGQTCVVTCDTCLPRAFFEALFARHGIAVDALFLSAEEQATKRDDGALYRCVAADTGVPPEAVCHIGDNAFSDVQRAAAQGLAAHWYQPVALGSPAPARDVQAAAVAGLARAHVHEPDRSAWWRHGFGQVGPIMFAASRWLRERVAEDRLDRLLFLSPAGNTLHALWRHAGALCAEVDAGSASESARKRRAGDVLGRSAIGHVSDTPAAYVRCSLAALTLSAIDDGNFDDHLPFLLSGATGLSAREVFARVGVEAPGEAFLRDAGLTPDTRLEPGNEAAFASTLEAWRWRILTVCRENRRGLHAYARGLGLADGDRVGLVGIGWDGAVQEAFAAALGGLIDLDLRGYSLCLSERAALDRPHLAMAAMIDDRLGADVGGRLFESRAPLDLLSRPPHDAVIGYRLARDGTVRFVEDPGRGADPRARWISAEIDAGARAFVERAEPFFGSLPIEPGLAALAAPLIRLATAPTAEEAAALGGTWNVDAWTSSAHVRTYLAAPEGTTARGPDAWPAGAAALRGAGA